MACDFSCMLTALERDWRAGSSGALNARALDAMASIVHSKRSDPTEIRMG